MIQIKPLSVPTIRFGKQGTNRGLSPISSAGPWFASARFSLVDAVFGPVFRYFDVFDAIRDYGIFADVPKVRQWRRVLTERPSVRDAVSADYPERLRRFLKTHDAYLHRLTV